MPTVLRVGAYQFSFYSNERREPPHVHVVAGDNEAKLWLADCSVARSKGFADHELRKISQLVYENRDVILERWVKHFGRT
jgi:hypothetical protein